MRSLAAHASSLTPRALRPADLSAVPPWVLAGGLVLYLGLEGGGYDPIVRSQVGTVVWWTVLIGAAAGILPSGRLSRVAGVALALFAAFVAWTALASSWSLSSERSLQELSRVACYLGVLLLAVAIHKDRERALRHSVNAVGAAVVIIAALALASRLGPNAFPAAHTTAAFLAGARARLSWPLNYWNGLAALVALGLPLLLSTATSARTLRGQAAAAAALPPVVLCGYLTASRGGAIVSGLAVLAFVVLAPDRVSKLATTLVAAAGSAVLIAAAAHREAIQQGLTDNAAAVQGRQLVITIALVCVGVALAQMGIGLVTRHGTPPRALRISPRRAGALFAGTVALALVAALAAGAPSRLSHAWNSFKHPVVGVTGSDLGARLGSFSGNGRYDYWRVAVHATAGHRLDGAGPGTFQLLWDPRATVPGSVQNAHSLYVETLSDVGVVGLVLLVAFLLFVLAMAVRAVIGSRQEARTHAAGAAAALLAFMVSAMVEWVWQLPVLPVAFLVLAAAALAPAPREDRLTPPTLAAAPGERARAARLLLRLALVATALAALVAIAIPLGTVSAVRQSEAAVAANNMPLALKDARSAVRVEPGAASAQLQVALVLELERDLPGAVGAARRAIADEPQSWTGWAILSRLQAESGRVSASIVAYRQARSLDPLSPLFAQ